MTKLFGLIRLVINNNYYCGGSIAIQSIDLMNELQMIESE